MWKTSPSKGTRETDSEVKNVFENKRRQTQQKAGFLRADSVVKESVQKGLMGFGRAAGILDCSPRKLQVQPKAVS